jgi:hypothetical protein
MNTLYCVWCYRDNDWHLLDLPPITAASIPALLLIATFPLLFLPEGELPP